jgi:HEAT repeat protein
VLEAVTEEFAVADGAAGATSSALSPASATGGGRPHVQTGRRETRLEQAWRELGSLRPQLPEDLARVRAAAVDEDAAHRQVAANLLGEADPEVARSEWARLVRDPSRSVRRAALDAMVDAGRDELRPLLEAALGDEDAWVRWKAVRGLSELGASASREAIAALMEDSDFRVRQEAVAALR